MDVELTSLGVSRLQESTPEEREKATETVLKNLEEHDGYYSALVHYMTEFRNSDSKPNFKTFLKEFYGSTKMKEVDVRANKGDVIDKDNKMEKLKEAIKTEVKNILIEAKDDDDDATDKKATDAYKKKVMPLQDRIKEIDKEVKDLENELAGLKQEEKDMRREAAGMMMDKKVHLEILKMIKEVGVPMTETAGVKMYYEVAKMAYMEGLTAGMSKDN